MSIRRPLTTDERPYLNKLLIIAFRVDLLLDAGRKARVSGCLDQLLHAGLGIIERDNRFACLEGHVNFADAFDLGNRLLDDDRAGGAGHARYGQRDGLGGGPHRSEEHTSELQSQSNLVCRLLLEKKKKKKICTVDVTNSGG